MARLERAVVVLALMSGCAPSLPPQYVAHANAAEAATQRRDHLAAAAQWARAAEVADTVTDRQEALFRQATSYQRAGDSRQYLGLLAQLSHTPGPRQQRAAYDLALYTLSVDSQRGGQQVRATLVQFPGSGLARGALDRWMETLSPAQRVEELTELGVVVDEPLLSEHLLMEKAKNLELLHRSDAALSAYQTITENFPYPRGQYWDVAALRSAVLWLRKGSNSSAVAALREMLSHRERAVIVGSYERHYSDASLLLAYCLLGIDWRQAHASLTAFSDAYPASRERDEALWAAALLAQEHDLKEEACHDARKLKRTAPDSRYVGCLSRPCPELKPDKSCRDYVLRDRATAESTLRAALVHLLQGP